MSSAIESPAGTGGGGGTGPRGADGKTLLTTTGAPLDATGTDGDYAIDPGAQIFYGPRFGGHWPAGVSYKGAKGDPGAAGTNGTNGTNGAAGTNGTNGVDGKTIRNGSGAPNNALGADGDFYIDPTAQLVYGPKASGVWPAGVSYKGATGAAGTAGTNGTNGAAGAPGTNGTNGTNGKTILPTAGAPGAGVGTDGDYALDIGTGPNLYGPKASGAWPAAVLLKGPKGDAGGSSKTQPYFVAVGDTPSEYLGMADTTISGSQASGGCEDDLSTIIDTATASGTRPGKVVLLPGTFWCNWANVGGLLMGVQVQSFLQLVSFVKHAAKIRLCDAVSGTNPGGAAKPTSAAGALIANLNQDSSPLFTDTNDHDIDFWGLNVDGRCDQHSTDNGYCYDVFTLIGVQKIRHIGGYYAGARGNAGASSGTTNFERWIARHAKCFDVLVDDCEFTSASSSSQGSTGLNALNSQLVTFRNVRAHDIKYHGINGHGTTGMFMESCRSWNNTNGSLFEFVRELVAIGCWWGVKSINIGAAWFPTANEYVGNSNNGINLDGGEDHKIIGCHFVGNGGAGLNIQDDQDAGEGALMTPRRMVDGNSFDGNLWDVRFQTKSTPLTSPELSTCISANNMWGAPASGGKNIATSTGRGNFNLPTAFGGIIPAANDPNIPSSGNTLFNDTGFKCLLTTSGGSGVVLVVDGITAVGGQAIVYPGSSVKLTYTTAPTWQWCPL